MNHRARKRFGQHFLHDPAVIDRIVAAIRPRPGDRLVEIGPGRGSITLPLLRAAHRLCVIELDRDLLAPLQEQCGTAGELTLIHADALQVDYCELAGQEKLRVVGNLPYNISTPLLFHLLAQHDCIAEMYFMLQKEVVDRMAAAPGSRDFGRLSVMIQYRCRVTPLFGIGPGAFQPPPRVDSAFVQLLPWQQPPVKVDDEAVFEKLVRQAFGQRRKTLRNALRGLLEDEDMIRLGIEPSRRAETLEISEFAVLANHAATRQGQVGQRTP